LPARRDNGYEQDEMTYTSDVLDEEYKITFNDEREHSGAGHAQFDRRPALPPVLGCFSPWFGLLYQPR